MTAKLELTPEMAELMEKAQEDFFAAYWKKHATPEQEAKREAGGKTFKGAAQFVRSVAEAHRKGKSCVVIPDECAYWLLMEYMENQPEGARYGKEPCPPKGEPTPAPTPAATASRRRIARRMEAEAAQMTLF